MVARPKSLRRAAARVFEPLAALPALAILHWFGLIGHTPLWLMMTMLIASSIGQQPEVQRRLAGSGARRNLHRPLAVQFGLVGLMCYFTGWGPLLVVAFPIGAAMYLRTFGSAAWRPALIWTVVAITAGQVGVGLGWVYCYLSPTLAQVAGILGGQTGLFFIRALGLSVEQRERAEEELRRREERFRALVQDSSDVVTVVDRTGRTLYVGPGIEHLTGLQPEDFLEAEHSRWLHPGDYAEAARAFAEALVEPGGEHRTELRLWHANGGLRWVEVTLRNLLDNPAVEGLVATYRDITERRAIQQRLIHDAHHDPLTGLANRAAFLHGLEKSLVDGESIARAPAVLFVDLDGFKLVNDTHGHQSGDALIVAVAAMLRRSVLGSDIVGRLGGDEFGVVLTGVASSEDAVTVAKRILAEMDQPVLVGDQELYARASIGVAVADSGDTEADALLHQADMAMYSAKRRQTHSYQVYVDGMRDPAVDAVALDEELRQAVGNDELRLHYQPIVALDGGDLIGFEALMRWQHPTRGLLPPADFIPLAEQTGTISDLGAWALEQASRQVLLWQQPLPAGKRLELCVNLSPHQLERPDLVAEVLTILRRTGYDPADLVLEVTETALIKDEPAIPLLTALRAEGIRIALDDFGTGYSSLSYLTRLPVDILKIDRCFVAELNGTGSASAVAEAMIRLAQVLHLETVAEGVENAEQLTELTLLGCQNGQGYLFARPMEPEAVETWIARSAARSSLLEGPGPVLPPGSLIIG
jgi:diguanylate cyclase (GGDEF)-like protein/PAS domain S-box-containing protein